MRVVTRSNERWRSVPGWPHYEVSSLGRVRSLGIQTDAGFRKGRVLKTSNGDYPMVTLTRGPGTSRGFNVHALVLTAFRGPCPPGLEGCHNDGDGRNCRLGNLRWDTAANNWRDSVKHGRRPPKLTARAVVFIRQHPEIIERKLAARFGVKQNAVWKARNYQTWKHVT